MARQAGAIKQIGSDHGKDRSDDSRRKQRRHVDSADGDLTWDSHENLSSLHAAQSIWRAASPYDNIAAETPR